MENYERFGVLGEGTYGKVYKARHLPTGNIVAMKKISLMSNNQGVPTSVTREASILRALHSPYIVELQEVIYTEWDPSTPAYYLVFEFLDCDLKNFMTTHYGPDVGIEPPLAKKFCFQILLGLYYCHTRSIMHRDLKPQNLLVNEKTQDVKIADFSLSRVYSHPSGAYTQEVVTLLYRAPEILLGAEVYSPAIDIWSVGCILGEMVVGKPIFDGDCEIEQLLAIFKVLGTPNADSWPQALAMNSWHDYPQWSAPDLTSAIPGLAVLGRDGIELFRNMTKLSPTKRISARDAILSPYFDDIRANYECPF